MTSVLKVWLFLTCCVVMAFVFSIVLTTETPLPKGAQLICDYENGWREFTLNGNRYLFYSEWRGFGGYAAITQIHDKPSDLAGRWDMRDGVLGFEKGGR